MAELLDHDHWDEETRVAQWRQRVGRIQNRPLLMAASVALDAWEEIEPLQRSAWLGPLLTAACYVPEERPGTVS